MAPCKKIISNSIIRGHIPVMLILWCNFYRSVVDVNIVVDLYYQKAKHLWSLLFPEVSKSEEFADKIKKSQSIQTILSSRVILSFCEESEQFPSLCWSRLIREHASWLTPGPAWPATLSQPRYPDFLHFIEKQLPSSRSWSSALFFVTGANL